MGLREIYAKLVSSRLSTKGSNDKYRNRIRRPYCRWQLYGILR
ncbi:hypothetical protein RB2083_2601 [Rhodobacteraceae bacterium HTCC2083]|nr:hypothetical protein RB2083_2601 [Rhodobacteraceae bacterium HTCC2083]